MVLMNLFAEKEWTCRCREWSGLVGTMKEGKSGKNGESGISLYTLSCVRWMAGEKLLCSTGCPVWCSGMT